jgi:hypothetical protein
VFKVIVIAVLLMLGQPVDSGDFQWADTLARGQSFEIRNVHGSVRTVASEDNAVHVQGRRSGSSNVQVRTERTAAGVRICAGECSVPSPIDASGDSARVDFVVRIPDGVDLSVSAVDGDIDVSGAGAVIRAATINGSVVLHVTEGEQADFRANTISGRIDADFPIELENEAPAFLSQGGPRRRGPSPPQIVHALIGGGGRQIQVNTISGDIHVRQR